MSHALWTAGGVLGADRPSCPRAGDPPRRRCDATSRRPAVRPRQSPAVRSARPGRHDPSRVGSPASGTSRGLPRRAGSRRSGLPRRVPGAAPAAPRRRGPPECGLAVRGRRPGARPVSTAARGGVSGSAGQAAAATARRPVLRRPDSGRLDDGRRGSRHHGTPDRGRPAPVAASSHGLAVADALARIGLVTRDDLVARAAALSRLRGIGRARYLRTSSNRLRSRSVSPGYAFASSTPAFPGRPFRSRSGTASGAACTGSTWAGRTGG